MSVGRTVRMLGLTAVSLTLGLGWLFRRLRSWLGPQGALKEVLFFPTALTCVEHLFRPRKAPPLSCHCPLPHDQETPFTRLLRHLLSATVSLDLCIFAFSNQELCRAVLHLQSKGVAVRVVTDREYMSISGSQIGVLRREGIDVRHEISAVYMHHKFAVVDGRLLITGSLNWTLTAIQSNKENILVTDEPDLVGPFILEFQRLWESNNPA